MHIKIIVRNNFGDKLFLIGTKWGWENSKHWKLVQLIFMLTRLFKRYVL